ncbi:MAG: hypothetical protein ACOY4Q_11440 [Bacillota bacterium]
MTILGLVIFFGLIIAFEAPWLVREKMWREPAAFAGLLVISMVLTLAPVLRLELLNPTHMLNVIFKPVTEVVIKLLE